MIEMSSDQSSDDEFVTRAAHLANNCVAIHHQFEIALSDALRVAFTEARLIYMRGEHSSLLQEIANKALTAAFAGGSPAKLALAIEVSFSLAIEERLLELAESQTAA